MTVKRLLQRRGEQELITVTPETLVYDAIKLMADHDIGALLVMEGPQLVGIITERDYLTKLILKGRASNETAVGDVMTRRVLYVEPSHTVEQCMALMTERRVRHLPVIEGGKTVGIVSMRDVVANLIAEKEFMIEQLEQYIYGPPLSR
jgi:CBS domain-containing protein